MEEVKKAMSTCVLSKPLKIGDTVHDEGEVVHLDSDLATGMISAGMLREATEDDLYGDKEGEEDSDDGVDGSGGTAPETDAMNGPDNDPNKRAVNRLTAKVEQTIQKAVDDVADRLVKANRTRPQLPTPHVAGSDEWRTGGFKGIGEYCVARYNAARGDWDSSKKLNRFKTLTTKYAPHVKFSPPSMGAGAVGQGSDMVPIEYANELWKLSFADVPDLLGMMRNWAMDYQQLKIPTYLQPSASTSIYSTVTSEGAAFTQTVGDSSTATLDLVKATVFVNVTDELLRFSPYHVGSVIEQVAPERIRFIVNDSVINGSYTGVNLIGNAATISVVAQTPGRIEYNDVLNMRSALLQQFLNDDTVWLCNPYTIPEIYSIGYPSREAATVFPAFTPGGFTDMLGAKPEGRLLGKRIYVLENCPVKGQRGALILVNLKSLAAGCTGLIGDTTPYLYFEQAINSWRFMFYFNSTNPLTQPYVLENGGPQSNICVLTGGSTSSS